MTKSSVTAAKPVRSAAPLPRFDGVAQDVDPFVVDRGEQLGGPVSGAVVDHDELADPRRVEHLGDGVEDRRLLVEGGHHHRQAAGRRHRVDVHRKRSSLGCRGRSRSAAPSPNHDGSTPRQIATGMPAALPQTRSAAAASSSTMQTSVTWSSRPSESVDPRRSAMGTMPGAADGHVGQAPPPRSAEGVGHDHRDVDAEPVAERVADAPGRAVGVDAAAARRSPRRCWTGRRRRWRTRSRARSRR